ncbi:helix-turn-helix transcriptional regulator [Halobacillus rhizosphaerae]|uniref:response regulator transcription factor n=1 Tax=Halobacillus rhizosphaerae TaxID=3064889 RepID=UPI00398B6A1A
MLSHREKQIFSLLVNGSLNKEIAHALHISDHTVKVHLRNIYRKLDVNNKVELILRYKD